MNKTIKYALLSCLGILGLTSCIGDDVEVCDTYVRFVYDYNIGGADMNPPGIDLFHKQASKVDLFIFDGQGVFLQKISRTASAATFSSDFRLGLPAGLPTDAQLVAWSGLYDEDYTVTELVAGQSTLEDLTVAVKPTSGSLSDRDIQPLWHGTQLGNKNLIQYSGDVITVSMVKNTNNIRINLEVIDEDNNILEEEDFAIEITSANKAYDYGNNVISATDILTYNPFVSEFNAETGLAAELKLLRLMADRQSVLKITDKSRSEVILEKDITPYLYASRLNAYKSMPEQEYLDREDTYRITIFLVYKETGHFIASEIHINEWFLRLQNSPIDPEH